MLNVVSVDFAKDFLKNNFHKTIQTEFVSLYECFGRTLSQDIISRENVPSFSRSTMDGYAVKAEDTFGASMTIPAVLDLTGEIMMGDEAKTKLNPGECVKISTGAMLPAGADAVVPVEITQEDFGDSILIYGSVSPSQNVTQKGDDIRKGNIILEKGTRLGSSHIGVLAAIGVCEVPVFKKLTIGIISTGDEIVPAQNDAPIGKIRDINTFVLNAFANKYSCIPKCYGIINDNFIKLKKAVKKASDECDIVLISGGSSAGERDMTARIISEYGEVSIHGLAMKPGKPTIIGHIDHRCIFGLPGHPAACYFVAEILVGEYIKSLYNNKDKAIYFDALSGENISSNNGREEYICVKIKDGIAYPLHAKSGLISMLSVADGSIKIGRDCEGIQKNETVQVYPI